MISFVKSSNDEFELSELEFDQFDDEFQIVTNDASIEKSTQQLIEKISQEISQEIFKEVFKEIFKEISQNLFYVFFTIFNRNKAKIN